MIRETSPIQDIPLTAGRDDRERIHAANLTAVENAVRAGADLHVLSAQIGIATGMRESETRALLRTIRVMRPNG